MPKNKFSDIYSTLKKEIQEGIYNDTMLLPTEMLLIERFETSRNTVRRAIKQLNDDGLVYSVKGRGVVILESSTIDKTFTRLGNFQGIKQLSAANEVATKTKVTRFEELTVDEELSKRISFHPGERIYKVERLRIVNEQAMMYDTSYFKKAITGPIEEKIFQESIYDYIDKNLDFKVAASKTIMKVVSAIQKDFDMIDLGTNNCVGEIENIVYTDQGKLFEHTFIRYIPNEYVMVSFSQRQKD